MCLVEQASLIFFPIVTGALVVTGIRLYKKYKTKTEANPEPTST